MIKSASANSLMMVTISTKANGATNEMRNPTLSASIIWERAMRRKNKLKKYLMWLDSNADRLDSAVLRHERFELHGGKGGFLDASSERRV